MAHTAESHASLRRFQRFGLTEDELFRLWKAAIKDDDKFVDKIIRKMLDEMISFDRERTEAVMGLAVRRHRDAGRALQSLFADMQEIESAGATLIHPTAASRRCAHGSATPPGRTQRCRTLRQAAKDRHRASYPGSA